MNEVRKKVHFSISGYHLAGSSGCVCIHRLAFPQTPLINVGRVERVERKSWRIKLSHKYCLNDDIAFKALFFCEIDPKVFDLYFIHIDIVDTTF
jgi:hypothetical protein